jgi:hypothetical protein
VLTAATHKTQSDSLVQVDDLLPLIAQARQSGDPLIKAQVKRISYKAAVTLGSLPKGRKRTWTGWVRDVHFWKGRRAVFDGRVVEVMGVLRGQALVTWGDPQWVEGVRRQVVQGERLVVYKCPAAVWLGKLKLGCVERKSAAKTAAAQRNGSCPCRQGRRGRPRKSIQPATPYAHQSIPATGPMPGTPYPLDFESAVAYYSRPRPPQPPAPTA